MPEKPNILVFLTDDLGQWASNCYGCGDIVSPNLDHIARSGARMTARRPQQLTPPAPMGCNTGIGPNVLAAVT